MPQGPVDPRVQAQQDAYEQAQEARADAQAEQEKARAAQESEAIKAQGEIHAGAVVVAKAVSDCYYKIDGAMTKLQPSNEIFNKLKGIRDTIFVQKGVAEQCVQEAGIGGTQGPPPSARPAPTQAPALQPPPPAPQATPAPAPITPMASAKAASMPSMQAEQVWGWLQEGKSGEAGHLSTDGKVVMLHGHPIFKLVGNMAYGSWAGFPTLTTAANINSLAILAGIGRCFSIHQGMPSFKGADVPTDSWIALGAVKPTPAVEGRMASTLPRILLPRID